MLNLPSPPSCSNDVREGEVVVLLLSLRSPLSLDFLGRVLAGFGGGPVAGEVLLFSGGGLLTRFSFLFFGEGATTGPRVVDLIGRTCPLVGRLPARTGGLGFTAGLLLLPTDPSEAVELTEPNLLGSSSSPWELLVIKGGVRERTEEG